MHMTITVTQDDIDRGCRKHWTNCPIAHAASRALGGWVKVRQDSIEIVDYFDVYPRIPLPGEAQRFIAAFDCGWRVAPFAFTIDVPTVLSPVQTTEPELVPA